MGKDRYVFLEASEMLDLCIEHSARISEYAGAWTGQSMAQLQQNIVTGDTSMVQESDDFLNQIEDLVPMSKGWRNVDDVVGAIPNVPAFLAGHPQHMRRRERTARDNAPLAIYMDLTSSGGIDARKVQRRGIVLMALTRMLVEHRPVELWVGASLGNYGGWGRGTGLSGTVAWRIDTTPLDLARAAYHIGSTAMSRMFGYGLNHAINQTAGSWPFGNYEKHCATAEKRLKAVMDWGDVMYVPPVYLNDPLTTDPVGWLKRVMRRYVPSENNGDE